MNSSLLIVCGIELYSFFTIDESFNIYLWIWLYDLIFYGSDKSKHKLAIYIDEDSYSSTEWSDSISNLYELVSKILNDYKTCLSSISISLGESLKSPESRESYLNYPFISNLGSLYYNYVNYELSTHD